jgi:hypothetical protein
MSYRIIWDPAALTVFYRLSMHSATMLDRAVITFVEKGRGEIFFEAPYHHLRAGFYTAMLAIDHAGEQVSVIRVYRSHPR